MTVRKRLLAALLTLAMMFTFLLILWVVVSR
jgi:hypothetical protein